MTCPMFKDYTRTCIESFKEISKITSYNLCESDKFEECPAYQIEYKKRGQCEFLEECKKNSNIDGLDFETVKEFGNKYCLSKENKKNCARYKLLIKKEKVSNKLLANGTINE